jgi:hypothetical protein
LKQSKKLEKKYYGRDSRKTRPLLQKLPRKAFNNGDAERGGGDGRVVKEEPREISDGSGSRSDNKRSECNR